MKLGYKLTAEQFVKGRWLKDVPMFDPEDTPKPGSKHAVDCGCLCAEADNHYGKGWGGDGEKYGWVITEGCPIHRRSENAKE